MQIKTGVNFWFMLKKIVKNINCPLLLMAASHKLKIHDCVCPLTDDKK